MMNPRISRILPVLLLLACLAADRAKYAEVERAVFNFGALQPSQQVALAVVLKIDSKYHAQSNKPTGAQFETGDAKLDEEARDEVRFSATLDPDPAVKAFAPVYPEGKSEKFRFDPKPLSVYEGTVTVYIPIQVAADAKAGPLTMHGHLHYQVCDDKACYQPTDTPFSVETKIVAAGQAVEPANADDFKALDPKIWTHLVPQAPASGATTGPTTKGQTFFGFELKHDSYVLAFIAAFVAGIIFNAVPCVLPVLPIKAIGFYEVSQHNRARSLAFGAVFSLGVIASFGVLALIIVVYRVVAWGQMYSNPFFSLAIVLVLLVMAIGTFGAFSVNLPTAVYNVTPRHDTYTGNFLFGILTAVLSTPCTFGLFLGLLVWAAEQPAAIGTSLVMTVGAGMAFPYLLLSAFPEVARRFPRTGPWSELVKQLMAFLLLGSAVFFARRFITPISGADAFWWILFGVAVLAGAFLVFKSFTISPAPQARLIATAIALLMVSLTFVIVLKIVNQPYQWTPYSKEAFDAARKSKQVVVVEFTAAWCTNCEALEASTLHSRPVVAAVKNGNVAMLRVDLTSTRADGWSLLQQLSKVAAIPYTAVYGPDNDMPIRNLTGIYSPEDLVSAIHDASEAPSRQAALATFVTTFSTRNPS